jgi:hypothetical protein
MLKISLVETSTHCRMVLEGRMIGAGVRELKTLSTRLKSELKVGALVIDIRNVVLISQEGENALLRLINQGAKLGTEGVLAKCIVQQLAHRSKRQISDLVDASPASARKRDAHRPAARNSGGPGSSGNEIKPETHWNF